MESKNFFVLGGSSGIGLEIVRALHETGAEIIVGSRSDEESLRMEGVKHNSLDVSSDFKLEGLPDVLNGLVYCPGTIRLKSFQRLEIDDFMEDMQINLLGAVRTIQVCLPKLKKSKSGASVVLFSTVAVQTGMPLHASVAASKGAVEGLTRSLAAEFAPRIRFNAIAPSLTDTPLAQNLLSTEEKRQASADRHPLKRIGSPREIASLAVHLLSDAGSWITGQIIQVDGGMSALRTFR